MPARTTVPNAPAESIVSSVPAPEIFPLIRSVAPLASRNPPVNPPKLVVLARMKSLVSVRLLPLVCTVPKSSVTLPLPNTLPLFA